MKRRSTGTRAAAIAGLALLLLAGCGGGSDSAQPSGVDSPPSPQGGPVAGNGQPSCDAPAEGVMTTLPSGIFGGTIDGAEDGSFVLVTRDPGPQGNAGGTLFYGLDLSGPPRVTGVVTFSTYFGCSAADPRARNARIYAHGTQDPNQPGAYVFVTLDPSVPSLTGSLRTVDGPAQSRRLAGGPIPGSTFNPKARPDLPGIVGGWTMVDPLGTPGAVTVSNDGELRGTYRGCTFGGTVEPAPDGANLFVVHLDIKPCSATNGLTGFDGFLLAIPLAAGGTQLLLWADASNGVDWAYVLAVGKG